ncbi:glutathione S-transferase family protein [Insolitispirillum peregrinum]|uniref:glutathione S-transferase family protein n=1 Tax=Insolitispirillum peregrinum TaxID=80876 RepID=UPI003611CB8F
MKLIGLLDSPYVRRVAISLTRMGLPFTHEPLSVFRDYTAFAAYNPVVKAPTLITDAGVTLMDSGLILEYAERLVDADHSLLPGDLADLARAQRITGLAMAVCEKAVQVVYELKLRPEDKRHQPWLERINGQLDHACRLLDAEVAETIDTTPWLFGERPLQADISTAVACRFTLKMLPSVLSSDRTPSLIALSDRAEALAGFQAWPHD